MSFAIRPHHSFANQSARPRTRLVAPKNTFLGDGLDDEFQSSNIVQEKPKRMAASGMAISQTKSAMSDFY